MDLTKSKKADAIDRPLRTAVYQPLRLVPFIENLNRQ
jgi:hypothetical protein